MRYIISPDCEECTYISGGYCAQAILEAMLKRVAKKTKFILIPWEAEKEGIVGATIKLDKLRQELEIENIKFENFYSGNWDNG